MLTDNSMSDRLQEVITDSISIVEELLTPTEREARKPDISKLPNAIDNLGMPLFDVGDKIIIERRSVVLAGKPYLDTKTYTVKSIDVNTGYLALFDDTLSQSALSNYIEGLKKGFIFKLSKGNVISTKKKRGRPRKNPIEDLTITTSVPLDQNGQPVKKKRGRPPGSKNRDKETIKAEKKEHRAARTERKASRKTNKNKKAKMQKSRGAT